MRVLALGREDPLEEKMATHSSSLAWKIPWTEQPGGLQSWGRTESNMTEVTYHTHTKDKEEGPSEKLQSDCSGYCPEIET